jgi:hypothetical protein
MTDKRLNKKRGAKRSFKVAVQRLEGPIPYAFIHLQLQA